MFPLWATVPTGDAVVGDGPFRLLGERPINDPPLLSAAKNVGLGYVYWSDGLGHRY